MFNNNTMFFYKLYNNLKLLFFFDVFEGYSVLYQLYSFGLITMMYSSFVVYMSYSYFICFLLRSSILLKNNLFDIGISFLVNVFHFVKNLVVTYLQHKNTLFFIWISFIFFYIGFNNLLGILPFSFTINSHLNITSMLSFISWLGIVFIGFSNYSISFFKLFIFYGIPNLLISFLSCIELLSYLFRFLSLSLRLFANIVAGHILLETVYVSLYKMFFTPNNNKVLNLLILFLPLFFFILLIMFEMSISVLQGYIFIVLVLIYLKDSLLLH